MAISSEIARKVVEQIIKNGKVVRAYLGHRARADPAGRTQGYLGFPKGRRGARRRGPAESPAAKAGIRRGDMVVGLDGKDVDDPGNLRTRAFTLPIGSKVPVELYREGKKQTRRGDRRGDARAGRDDPALARLRGGRPPARRPVRASGHPGRPRQPGQEAGLREGMKVVGVGRRPVREPRRVRGGGRRRRLDQGLPLGISRPTAGSS